MRRIAFVYDFTSAKRAQYRAAIDALVDPVLKHLPNGFKADQADPEAINVRYWHNNLRTPQYDVFVSHGIGDKRWRDMHRVAGFAYIFHSGPRWQERYIDQGCPPERLYQVGYAKLDPIFDGTVTRKAHAILWAPTHRRFWPTEHKELRQTIAELPFEVVESLHPMNTDSDRHSTLQALVDADVVIADAGSTIFEAWALGKPVVFPDFAVRGTRLLRGTSMEDEIYHRQIGYHAHTPGQMARTIERAREGGITAEERQFIDDVLPEELRGRSGAAHAAALMEIAERHERVLPRRDEVPVGSRRLAPYVRVRVGPGRFVALSPREAERWQQRTAA